MGEMLEELVDRILGRIMILKRLLAPTNHGWFTRTKPQREILSKIIYKHAELSIMILVCGVSQNQVQINGGKRNNQ
jgi:hypothetical protein